MELNHLQPFKVSLLYGAFPFTGSATAGHFVVQPELGGEGDQGHSMIFIEVLRNYCWLYFRRISSFQMKRPLWQRSFFNLVPAVPWEGVTACLVCKNIAQVA